MSTVPSETFAPLNLPFIRHAFIDRIPGLDVTVERTEALWRLDEYHTQARRELGCADKVFVTAEQVHGNKVAVFEGGAPLVAAGADGVVTNEKNAVLGIYVADCCAVYLADPVAHVIGLAHSGRKGTELGIATAAIETMRTRFGSNPRDIIALLGPCIRPPFYEVDFAAQIAAQCRAAGVSQIFDCGRNTASDLGRYYSYRMEHGKTGRMLALLALD